MVLTSRSIAAAVFMPIRLQKGLRIRATFLYVKRVTKGLQILCFERLKIGTKRMGKPYFWRKYDFKLVEKALY